MAISNVIEEHDCVELLVDVSPILTKGMRGTVIIDPRPDIDLVHVEFVDDNGETIEMVDVPKSSLQVYWKVNDHAVVKYENGWNERDDLEAPAKGWRGDVTVVVPSGACYRLSFYDPARAGQEVAETGVLAERNLILLPQTDRDSIEGAIHELYRTGELKLNYMPE